MTQELEMQSANFQVEQAVLADERALVEIERANLLQQLEAARSALVGSVIPNLSPETIARLRRRWPMFPLPVTRLWFIGPLRFKPDVTSALLQTQFRHFIDQRLEHDRDEVLAPLRMMEEKLRKFQRQLLLMQH